MSKNNQPELDEILNKIYPEPVKTGKSLGYDTMDFGQHMKNVIEKPSKEEAKSQILTHYIAKQDVLDAVGEDEKLTQPLNDRLLLNVDKVARNELRAEIKKELGLEDEA